MSLFSSLAANPSHNKKPLFVSARGVLKNFDTVEELYLDIDKKDRIQNVGYKCKDSLAVFESIAVLTRGMSISQASKLSLNDIYDFLDGEVSLEQLRNDYFVPRPLVLLNLAIQDYLGLKHFNVTNELICRCLGVFAHRIESVIADTKNCKVKDITAETGAGAGCTSCVIDLEEMIGANSTSKIETYAGMRRVKFVAKVNELFENWRTRAEYEIEIIDLDGDIITIEITNPDETLLNFQDYLNNKLGSSFVLKRN